MKYDKDKVTPGAWRLHIAPDRHYLEIETDEENPRSICTMSFEAEHYMERCESDTDEPAIHDAHHIVHAVTLHDKLVEALENRADECCQMCVQFIGGGEPCMGCPRNDEARQLLTRAEGETK